MAAFPLVTAFLLLSITGEHVVLSGLKPPETNRLPEPPCEMYYPPDPNNQFFCPNVTAPICTTQRHTYRNECVFCLARWYLGSHIQFDRYGRCFT